MITAIQGSDYTMIMGLTVIFFLFPAIMYFVVIFFMGLKRMSRRMKMRIRFQDRRSHTGVMRGDVFGEIKWRWYQLLY